MPDSLDQLKELVSPPTNAVNTGSLNEWESVRNEIGLPLPRELYELNATYGSGYFIDGDFAIELHRAFRPGYPLLVEWNRRIFEQEEKRSPDLYRGMFEIGCYSRGDDFSSHGRVFWTIDVNSPQWLLGITRPLTRFDLSLTGLLVAIFSDKIQVPGFPSPFTALRFEPWARSEPGE